MATKSYNKWNVIAAKKPESIGKGHEASDHTFVKKDKVSEHVYVIDEKSAKLENSQAHNSGIMLFEIEPTAE